MSPSSTLNSCGSSSRRTFRSRRPIGVTRASSGWAHTCRPPLLESPRIVRNLYIVNGLPQLVEADLPQQAPDRRDARVVRLGPHLSATVARVPAHRAELVHRERLA